MERMSVIDAQTYWMSTKVPNDQFLLFCFDDAGADRETIAELIVRRAESIDDLRLRVRDVPATLDLPYWVPVDVPSDAVRIHPDAAWSDCLQTVAGLIAVPLDPRRQAWRVHLFGPVVGAPGSDGATSVVAVLQIVHALADGTRASSIARDLFGTNVLPAAVATPRPRYLWPVAAAARGVLRVPGQLAALAPRAWLAHRAHAALVRSSADAGDHVRAAAGSPRSAVNVAPGERRCLRVVLTDADRLRGIGGTVTVGALVVIADALAAHLELSTGDALRAEVTVAKSAPRRARNHFGNAGVDLHTREPDPARRAAAIRADLDGIRARFAHRVGAAESAAMAAIPAAPLKWGIDSFDPTVVPDMMVGHTVVSSVDRGPGDLVLAGGAVRFTAGFPALSPVQSLTHGVHGIGGTVAISVAASPDVVRDIDAYVGRIEAAVGVGRTNSTTP